MIRENHVACPVIDLDEQPELVFPVTMPNHDHAAVCYYPCSDKAEKTTALAMLTSHLLAPIFFPRNAHGKNNMAT